MKKFFVLLFCLPWIGFGQTEKVSSLLEESELVIERLHEEFSFFPQRIIVSKFLRAERNTQFFEHAEKHSEKLFYAWSDDSIDINLFLWSFDTLQKKWNWHRSDASESKNASIYISPERTSELRCLVSGIGDTKEKFFIMLVCDFVKKKEEKEIDRMIKTIQETKDKIILLEKEGHSLEYIEICSGSASLDSHRYILTEAQEPFSVFAFSDNRTRHINLKTERWSGDSWIPRDICDMDEYVCAISCTFNQDIYKQRTMYGFSFSFLEMEKKKEIREEVLSFLLYR